MMYYVTRGEGYGSSKNRKIYCFASPASQSHTRKTGRKIPDEEFRRKADENLLILSKSSSFSLEERKNYFKQKWRKEHIWLFILLGLILIATVVLPFLLNKPWGIGITPLTAVIEYGYQNNKMMAYVERHLYD